MLLREKTLISRRFSADQQKSNPVSGWLFYGEYDIIPTGCSFL